MVYNIALVKGDGIGPEIVDGAVAVLEKIGEKFGHTFNFTSYLAGGCAIDATGKPLPEETVEYKCIGDKTTYYVCRDQTCLPPTNDIKSVLQ